MKMKTGSPSLTDLSADEKTLAEVKAACMIIDERMNAYKADLTSYQTKLEGLNERLMQTEQSYTVCCCTVLTMLVRRTRLPCSVKCCVVPFLRHVGCAFCMLLSPLRVLAPSHAAFQLCWHADTQTCSQRGNVMQEADKQAAEAMRATESVVKDELEAAAVYAQVKAAVESAEKSLAQIAATDDEVSEDEQETIAAAEVEVGL